MELFGLITLPVLETKQPFLNVVTEYLENIIVATWTILVSCAQVSRLYVYNTSKTAGSVDKKRVEGENSYIPSKVLTIFL